MTVFILEGPDGAGKSTLAQKIVDHLYRTGADTVQLWHFGPYTADHDPLVEYLDPLKNWRDTHDDQSVDHLIIDRFHIGEMVYGPIFRGKSKLEKRFRKKINEYLDEIGAVKIYMATPYDEVLRRFRERGDDFVREDQLYNIFHKYQNLLGEGIAYKVDNVLGFGSVPVDVEFQPTGWINWRPEHSLVFP